MKDMLAHGHAGRFKACVTSPPYNLGIEYADDVKDEMGRVEYLESFTPGWMEPCRQLLSDDGHLFVNVGGSLVDPSLPFAMFEVFRECGFQVQNVIHWIKSISFLNKQGDEVSQGHYKPINSGRFLFDGHEYIFHLTKTGKVPIDRLAIGVPYQDKSNVDRWGATGGNDKRDRGNVWLLPYETIRSRAGQRPHPATFPVELPKRCLQLAGVTGQWVLDPFVGLGNTLVAAREVGAAHAVGIDLSQGYVSAAEERLLVKPGVPVSS